MFLGRPERKERQPNRARLESLHRTLATENLCVWPLAGTTEVTKDSRWRAQRNLRGGPKLIQVLPHLLLMGLTRGLCQFLTNGDLDARPSSVAFSGVGGKRAES